MWWAAITHCLLPSYDGLCKTANFKLVINNTKEILWENINETAHFLPHRSVSFPAWLISQNGSAWFFILFLLKLIAFVATVQNCNICLFILAIVYPLLMPAVPRMYLYLTCIYFIQSILHKQFSRSFPRPFEWPGVCLTKRKNIMWPLPFVHTSILEMYQDTKTYVLIWKFPYFSWF